MRGDHKNQDFAATSKETAKNVRKSSRKELHSGFIEYVDTQEAENMVLPRTGQSEDTYLEEHVTHREIHPSVILGVMANHVIFPENNQFPRNLFSCGQSKQAASVYSSNYQNRIDTAGLVLNTGQVPIVKSRYLEFATKEQHPYGENAIVAVMCYTGNNVEDALIFNEGAIQRGLFNTTYYKMYSSHEEVTQTPNGTSVSAFMNIEDNQVVGLKPGYDYSLLDSEMGVIRENTKVDDKTILIGQATNDHIDSDLMVDHSIKAKKGQTGFVDKSFVTEGERGTRLAKARIREPRQPSIGDKFCSRAGQKGTVGIILPEADMPFTSDGIRPDLIVNPHAFPSRMTIGHIIETLIAKTGALYGGHGDCTAFTNKGSKHEQFGAMLEKVGYHKSGCELMMNGMTGELIESDIYLGPTYYLRLKHMVRDKINYRARGPRALLTRQTVKGRSNDGGLRIGEMDRDVLLAYGIADFVEDSMMNRGDEFYMAICNTTGTLAIYNEARDLFISPMIDGPIEFKETLDHSQLNIVKDTRYGRSFSIVKVPYCFKLLYHELQAMNVQMRIITDDNVDKLTRLTKTNQMEKRGTTNMTQIMQKTLEMVEKDKAEGDIKLKVEDGKSMAENYWVQPDEVYDDQTTVPSVFASGVFEQKEEDKDDGEKEQPKFQPQTPEGTPPPSKFQPQTPEGTPPPSKFQPQTPDTEDLGPQTPEDEAFGLSSPQTPASDAFGANSSAETNIEEQEQQEQEQQEQEQSASSNVPTTPDSDAFGVDSSAETNNEEQEQEEQQEQQQEQSATSDRPTTPESDSFGVDSDTD